MHESRKIRLWMCRLSIDLLLRLLHEYATRSASFYVSSSFAFYYYWFHFLGFCRGYNDYLSAVVALEDFELSESPMKSCLFCKLMGWHFPLVTHAVSNPRVAQTFLLVINYVEPWIVTKLSKSSTEERQTYHAYHVVAGNYKDYRYEC